MFRRNSLAAIGVTSCAKWMRNLKAIRCREASGENVKAERILSPWFAFAVSARDTRSGEYSCRPVVSMAPRSIARLNMGSGALWNIQ